MPKARSIVEMLGGAKIVSDFLGITTGAVSRWYAPVERGGCGGFIPSKHVPELCKLAKQQGKFLEPNMMF
jgi:hypothetical protein